MLLCFGCLFEIRCAPRRSATFLQRHLIGQQIGIGSERRGLYLTLSFRVFFTKHYPISNTRINPPALASSGVASFQNAINNKNDTQTAGRSRHALEP